jgi:hypothetical protein
MQIDFIRGYFKALPVLRGYNVKNVLFVSFTVNAREALDKFDVKVATETINCRVTCVHSVRQYWLNIYGISTHASVFCF